MTKMSAKSPIKPDVIFRLSENQLNKVKDLIARMKNEYGLILGSLNKDGFLALSYLPLEISQEIVKFANRKADDGALPRWEEE